MSGIMVVSGERLECGRPWGPGAGGHSPRPDHAGDRRRTRQGPGEMVRFSRKSSPFGKRSEGEGGGGRTDGVQPPRAGPAPTATYPPGRHPGRRPRPLGSAATVVRRSRLRPRPETRPCRRPAPNSPAAGWGKTMFAQKVFPCQTRQGGGDGRRTARASAAAGAAKGRVG